MLVEFASVVDALRCAVEVQRGMAERNAEVLDLERRARRWRELHLAVGNDAGAAPPRGEARDEAGDAIRRKPKHRQEQRAEEQQPVFGERGERFGK